MQAFLWTMLGLLAMANLGRVFWLVRGEFPPRTPGWTAVDLIGDLALMGWVIALLARGA